MDWALLLLACAAAFIWIIVHVAAAWKLRHVVRRNFRRIFQKVTHDGK